MSELVAMNVGARTRRMLDYLMQVNDVDYSTAIDAAVQSIAAELKMPERDVMAAYDDYQNLHYQEDF